MGGFPDYLRMVMGWRNGTSVEVQVGGGWAEAMDIFVPGFDEGQMFIPGAMQAQMFVPGFDQAEAH